MNSRYSKTLCGVAAALMLVPLAAEQAVGQGGDGYLFKQPVVSITLRAGMSMPRASSDLFTFTEEQLTVDKSDWNMPVAEFRFAVRASDRVEVMATAGGGSKTTRSEMREWEGSDGLPIEQTTEFATGYLTLGTKLYLMDRGQTVGRFAWIPAKWSPYVGAAGGFVFHDFRQIGEFVDYDTLEIFDDRFYSEGTAPTVHALAGVDMSLNNRVLLNAEARYGWGNDELGYDFVGFEKLDLAGLQITAGFTVRF